MENLILFGTGDRGKRLYKFLAVLGIEIKYWIDSDEKKWNTLCEGKIVYSPNKIKEEKQIHVCIAAIDASREMYNALVNYGLDASSIHSFQDTIIYFGLKYFDWNQNIKKNVFRDVFFDCTNGLVLGGIEAWSINLIKELNQENIFLISPKGNYNIEEDVINRAEFLELKSRDNFSWDNIRAILDKLQSRLPCTIITSRMNDMLLAACILKKKYSDKVRIVSVLHDGRQMTYKEHAELKDYVDCFVAVSEDIRNGLNLEGCSEKDIFHMTCPVDCIMPYYRKYSLHREEPIRIGYAGRIEVAQKRMDFLPLFLEELEKLNTIYRLQIAGSGPYLEDIKEFIRKRKLENKVDFVGVLERGQMPKFWTSQDIGVNFSDYEGRSISIMEAMKNGAVPIVTDTSGVREDITSGYNGYIVNIGDYVSMAHDVNYLSMNRNILEKMGNLSHERMMKKNNLVEHVNFWRTLLEKEN